MNKVQALKFGLIVPTLNPGKGWDDWLYAYGLQTVRANHAIVIDSGSIDGQFLKSVSYGFEVIEINKSDFNHGKTRQQAVNSLANDIELVVLVTQDAIFTNPESLERLLLSFQEDSVSAAFGRQLPHEGASQFGAHARYFNYGSESALRSLDSVSDLGFKTCFISNSFAAYRIKDLNSVGGFPADVILGEDACVAAKLILAGKKIAYVAESHVYHSHDYTVIEEFRRYFDTGVLHAQQSWLIQNFGGAGSEGVKFIVSEQKYLAKRAPLKMPFALFRNFVKLIGYRLGRFYIWIPKNLLVYLSMHKNYWQKNAKYK